MPGKDELEVSLANIFSHPLSQNHPRLKYGSTMVEVNADPILAHSEISKGCYLAPDAGIQAGEDDSGGSTE